MAGPLVTVACKMPNGLLLRLFRWEEFDEPVMGGGSKTVRRAIETGERITLNGYAVPFGEIPEQQIAGGYGITHNVPADFWAEWLKQNGESDLVKNNIVFAHAKSADTVSQAREYKKQRSGLEPIDPNKLPRGIKQAEEQRMPNIPDRVQSALNQ